MTKRSVVLRRLRSAVAIPLFDREPLFALARQLGVKPDQRSLFAWCAANGVGLDAYMLQTLPVTGRTRLQLWVEARHQEGIFWDCDSREVLGTLSKGKVKGEAVFAQWLPVLASTAPAEWEGAARKPGAKAEAGPALTARVDLELSSRAQVSKLSALRRRQLESASKELCGKKGLAALMEWCDDQGQGLACVVVSHEKEVRFEAWLTAALEDGVFFDAGKATLSGLNLSQGDVDASKSARERDVAALQRAISKVRAGRAPKWAG